MLARLLSKLGFDQQTPNKSPCVDCVVNGQEAVNKCAKKHYDLIFMDMQMPVMGGVEATSQILEYYRRSVVKEVRPFPPTICALTANVLASHREQCLSAGMLFYMSKPFDMTVLKTVLKDVWNIVTEQQKSLGIPQDALLNLPQPSPGRPASPSNTSPNPGSNGGDSHSSANSSVSSSSDIATPTEEDSLLESQKQKKRFSILETLRASDFRSVPSNNTNNPTNSFSSTATTINNPNTSTSTLLPNNTLSSTASLSANNTTSSTNSAPYYLSIPSYSNIYPSSSPISTISEGSSPEGEQTS